MNRFAGVMNRLGLVALVVAAAVCVGTAYAADDADPTALNFCDFLKAEIKLAEPPEVGEDEAFGHTGDLPPPKIDSDMVFWGGGDVAVDISSQSPHGRAYMQLWMPNEQGWEFGDMDGSFRILGMRGEELVEAVKLGADGSIEFANTVYMHGKSSGLSQAQMMELSEMPAQPVAAAKPPARPFPVSLLSVSEEVMGDDDEKKDDDKKLDIPEDPTTLNFCDFLKAEIQLAEPPVIAGSEEPKKPGVPPNIGTFVHPAVAENGELTYDGDKDSTLEVTARDPKDDGRITLVTAKQTDLEEIYVDFAVGNDGKGFMMGMNDDLPLHFCYGPAMNLEKACQNMDYMVLDGVGKKITFNKKVKFAKPPVFAEISPGSFSSSPQMMEMEESMSGAASSAKTYDLAKTISGSGTSDKGPVHHMYGTAKLPEPGVGVDSKEGNSKIIVDSRQTNPNNVYIQMVNARDPQGWKFAMSGGSGDLKIGYGPNNQLQHFFQLIVKQDGSVHIFGDADFAGGAEVAAGGDDAPAPEKEEAAPAEDADKKDDADADKKDDAGADKKEEAAPAEDADKKDDADADKKDDADADKKDDADADKKEDAGQ